MDTKGKVENMWKYVWKDILEQACFLPVTAFLALIYYSLRRAIVKRRGMLNRETAFLEIVHGNVSDDARADHSS